MSGPAERFIEPCPLCGSSDCSPNSSAHHVWVDCDSCGARGGKVGASVVLNQRGPQVDKAIDAWNKRALNADVAELIEAASQIRTTLSLTRSNVMTEIKRGAKQWEGVPELLKARIETFDAALARVRGAA